MPALLSTARVSSTSQATIKRPLGINVAEGRGHEGLPGVFVAEVMEEGGAARYAPALSPGDEIVALRAFYGDGFTQINTVEGFSRALKMSSLNEVSVKFRRSRPLAEMVAEGVAIAAADASPALASSAFRRHFSSGAGARGGTRGTDASSARVRLQDGEVSAQEYAAAEAMQALDLAADRRRFPLDSSTRDHIVSIATADDLDAFERCHAQRLVRRLRRGGGRKAQHQRGMHGESA